MKEVIYYQAEDGMKFNSERECLEYEFSKMSEPIDGMLGLWNGDGEKIDLRYGTDLDNAWGIRCNSLTAAKFLKDWAKREHCLTPYDNIDLDRDEVPLGTFVWFEDAWHLTSEIADLFNRMGEQMEKGENTIEMVNC